MSEPLTRARLLAILRATGIPDHVYAITDLHEPRLHEGYGLRHQGPVKRRHWEVYYTERGGFSDVRRHATEDSACRDLLDRICPGVGPVT